jgi:hypothetical protein
MASMKTVGICLVLCAAACAPTPATVPSETLQESVPTEMELQELALAMSFLPGTFETFASPNMESDSTPIRIRHARFWPERRNEGWIYAEYARQDDDAHPFRQRIYRLRPVRGSSGVQVTVYELPGEPARHVREWQKAQPFSAVSPDQLREQAGCGFRLDRQMDMILGGGTPGTSCRGAVPGVHHEHWEFQFTSSSLRTWETGLDASGRKVSGPPAPWETRRMARQAR